MPTLPPVFRPVIEKVKEHPAVESVKIRYERIIVKFKDGITESWLIRPGKQWWNRHVVPSSDWFKSDVKIVNKYESSMFDEEWNELVKAHFVIGRKNILQSGFCNVRLKIHSLILSLAEDGWVDFKHPDDVIFADFEKVKKANKKKFIMSVRWIRHISTSVVPPGFNIITQCSDWGNVGSPTFKEAWSNKRLLCRVINNLVKRKKPITRDNISRCMAKFGWAGVKVANPAFYASLFQEFFRIKKPIVLDVCPDIGSKAIGVKSIDGTYYYVDSNPIFAKSMDRYIGDLHPDDGTGVDIVILNDIYDRTLDWLPKLNKYRGRGELTIAFVAREHINSIKADKIMRCTVRLNAFDYIAVYY